MEWGLGADLNSSSRGITRWAARAGVPLSWSRTIKLCRKFGGTKMAGSWGLETLTSPGVKVT